MGALLDGTPEVVLAGLIVDDYGEQRLARIASFTVPGIGRNVSSTTTAARKGTASSFDVNKPRMEAADIAVPLPAEDDGLYLFKLDLNADD